jgi:serine/threonine protein kinase/Tol biopolymer transport system component
MSLTPGKRLGPYEIVALAGSGGMGEVYRATDTRLGRTVAVKVLLAQVADTPERLQRFEREARIVAGLNHPHICALHDVGHDSGIHFLVLEYLEVHTLAERVQESPLPIERVLQFGIEIADALDHAHRNGVVHRDLKPGNIMLTKSGVKVLDFGLAKLRNVDSLPAVSTVATGRAPLTAEDAILGTFQYMAPEQLEGRDADARSDIFALGALIYEMATGRKAFEAGTQAAAIGLILHTDPAPMSSLRSAIPPALDRVVARCLAKDPDNRWQTARDLVLELKWISEGAPTPGLLTPVRAPRQVREGVAWTMAALLAVSTLLLAVLHFVGAPDDPLAVRFSFVPGQPPLGSESVAFSLSPDGRRLVFVAPNGPGNQLWIRSLDSMAAQPIAGTEGAALPFWSPDGLFIGFEANDKLKKVAASGGPAQILNDAPGMVGGTWNRDGDIVFARGNRTALYRVSATGGHAAPVTTLDVSRGENTHRFPQFLPDGRRFLYLARSTQSENSAIYVGSLDSPLKRRLLSVESNVAYGLPGYLLFARDGALLGLRFDARTLETQGNPVKIVENIAFTSVTSQALFSISIRGVLAYQIGASSALSHLAWFSRAGTLLESDRLDDVEEPSIAPDGKRVVGSRWSAGTSDLWIVDVARGSNSRLTLEPSGEFGPIWSPNRQSIVFYSNRDGPSDLYQIAAGGTGEVKLLLKSSAVKHPTDWSPDGRFIVYEAKDPQTNWDLWTVPVSGNAGATPYLHTSFAERLGRLSPNGEWMAYVSNESGNDEVYVRPFRRAGNKWRISTAGGSEPRWRRDGNELFYLAANHRLMVVSVDTHKMFNHGVAKVLFETRVSQNGVWGYDVTPDGQRFVVSIPAGDAAPAPIAVVLNWTTALPK